MVYVTAKGRRAVKFFDQIIFYNIARDYVIVTLSQDCGTDF